MKKPVTIFLAACIGLFVKAQTGPRLVATLREGGAYNGGTIIRYTGGEDSVITDVNLPSNPHGGGPSSSTLTEARDGRLYALDYAYLMWGAIIEYDYHSHTYREMYRFDPTLVYDSVFEENNALVLANNGLLYGLAAVNFYIGGFDVFSYAMNASSVTYLTDETIGISPGVNGPMIQASNGNLYGVHLNDSLTGGGFAGVIFQYDILTATETDLFTLPNASNPTGALLEAGIDTLYGLSMAGGTNGGGTIFRYIIGADTDEVLYNLPVNANPGGSLIRANDGKLYGFTYDDGPYSAGTIFNFEISSRTYTILHIFELGSDGGYASGDLFQASDGVLYGMTTRGGNSDNGIIFQYNIVTSTYTKKVDLTVASGDGPYYGHFIEYMPVAIYTQPSDVTICIGAAMSFTATDTAASATVQWQLSTNNGTSFNNIPGATDTTYSLVTSAPDSGYQYRAIFTHNSINDTTDAATLNFWPRDSVYDQLTICNGQEVTVGIHTYSISGTFTDTLSGISVNDCDSIVTTHLTVLPAFGYSYSAAICSGSSYFFNGVGRTTTGNYADTLISVSGCDSIISLHLTVDSILSSSFSGYICAGQSYLFDGIALTTSGSYNYTLTATGGCDSIVTLNLIVLSTFSFSFDTSICSGQSFTYNGIAYTTGGQFNDTLTAANGCDSVITLHLTVNTRDTINQFGGICAGDSVYFYGIYIHHPGQYDTLLPGGCDTLVLLNLVVQDPLVPRDMYDTICANAPIFFNNEYLDSSGVYLGTFNNANPCDSSVRLHLTVIPPYVESAGTGVCQGDTVIFYGRVLTQTGVYSDTFTSSITGCDSVVILRLTVRAVDTVNLYETTCINIPVLFDGVYLDSTGVYTGHFTTTEGCDSTVMLTLTVKPTPVVSLSWDSMVEEGWVRAGIYEYGDTGSCLWSFGDAFTFQTDSNGELFVLLSGGVPYGGVYNGLGVVNDTLFQNPEFLNYFRHFPVNAFDTITYAYTDSNGCSQSTSNMLSFAWCEGINNLNSQPSFTLYPNPANDYTYIDFGPSLTGANLRLTDITGRELLFRKLTASPQQLPTGALAAGVYLVIVNLNGEVRGRVLSKE